MHNGMESVNVVPRHETCRDEAANPLSGQSKRLGNQLSKVYFVSKFCWVPYYTVVHRYTMLAVHRSNQQALHHDVSSRTVTTVPVLWKPLQLMLIYDSEICVPYLGYYADGQQVFLGSSTHNAQAQWQLRPLSRVTNTSVFFHGADMTVVLRARNTGYAPSKVQARKSDVAETANGTAWKNVWSTNPLWRSMVRAMGI